MGNYDYDYVWSIHLYIIMGCYCCYFMSDKHFINYCFIKILSSLSNCVATVGLVSIVILSGQCKVACINYADLFIRPIGIMRTNLFIYVLSIIADTS